MVATKRLFLRISVRPQARRAMKIQTRSITPSAHKSEISVRLVLLGFCPTTLFLNTSHGFALRPSPEQLRCQRPLMPHKARVWHIENCGRTTLFAASGVFTWAPGVARCQPLTSGYVIRFGD